MSDARRLDHGTPPNRYARGWHCIGLADSFRDGKPHRVEAFGTRLVVWSDSDGAFHVLDGFCRHMGGDLTSGTVKGDEIACPFHDWRWGGDGRCRGIPYAKRVPLRARTRSWHTTERNKQLFVWHDHEGNPPLPEQEIPEIPGIHDGAYSNWTWHSLLIEGANCREIIDNNVDMAHFFYVHFAYPTTFRNVLDGHTATQIMTSKARPDVHRSDAYAVDAALLSSEATYYGPSYMIDRLTNDSGNGFAIESMLINCHYPVTQHSFVLQWGVAVKLVDGLDQATGARLAVSMATHFGDGFLQDVEIWKTKAPVENPLLCEEDGPVYQHRRWYEQFYRDRDDIEPDMTTRFEFEVDTTHANVHWQQEIAANLTPGR